jgi:hypothetical protein
VELLFIYKDTFWKIWLRLGYLLYLVDRLIEKLFDLTTKIGWFKIAGFIRTYGTGSMDPSTRASAWADTVIDVRDEGENWLLWRCYFGWTLFKETLISYFQRRPALPPTTTVLTEEEIRQLLS